jgi:tRNA (adenine22-N1)-methyltransferase
MELRGRLLAVAQKIPECHTLIDIGTDHAYVPVYAVQKKICQRAFASDLRSGPVKAAQKNISKYGLAEHIKTSIGNGLEPLEVGDSDVIVIAGMGGLLISEIIQGSHLKAEAAVMLVLQPMNAADVLRSWLCENGFAILGEALAEDDDKIYNIICSKWSGTNTNIDEFSCFFGFDLIDGTDPVLKKYLQKKLSQLNVIIEGRKSSEKGRIGLDSLVSIRNRISDRLSDL